MAIMLHSWRRWRLRIPPVPLCMHNWLRLRRMRQVQPSSDTVHDVVVVGSGAGGGTVTKVLADAGVSVLLMEAGPMLELKELKVPRTANAADDVKWITTEMQKQFEAWVRDAPEQWSWNNRRWG